MKLYAFLKKLGLLLLAGGLSLSLVLAPCAGYSLTPPVSQLHNLPATLSIELRPVNNGTSVIVQIKKPAGKTAWMTLFDKSGDVLERVSLTKDSEQTERRYNFSDAEEGTYSFEVCAGNKTIRKTVTLKRMQQETLTHLTIE
ncbi:MAG: hypothetical protein QM764_11970 [Chitinophagaceae bacterium]